MTIGQIIKLCRQKAGMTQAQLAELIPGLDQPCVSRYERGVQVPSAEVLLWVVDVTDVWLDLRPARTSARTRAEGL